jgi:salicylate hydroxylase
MTKVAVVGAGMGGLVAALALSRAGADVAVYEQAPALGEVGAGITMSPNASRILIHLGLGDALERLGFVPGIQWTQHWQSGAVLMEADRSATMVERYGAPYSHIHRADLHAMLAGALPDGVVRLGKQMTSLDASGHMTFADGTKAEADVVIGADGVRSAVRAALYETAPPHFTGQVAWRGIVPADALPEAVRAMPPGIHIGPQRLFMRYPVRGGTLINYAAFVEMEGWTGDSWSIRSTVAELLGHFEGWDETVRAIIAATPADQLFKWALHARQPLERWTRGRVTLLGDAAHAMLPFMGQGAATAMEDGMVLARCLLAFPPNEALERYEGLRRDRTTMVQTQSRLLGLKFQDKDPDSLGAGPIQNEETLGLFGYDAVTVPLTLS